MSQYYQHPGPYLPPPPPEDASAPEYYEDVDYEFEGAGPGAGTGPSLVQQIAVFFTCGCLGFLCASACAGILTVAWIFDAGSGLVETSVPGSDLGLAYENPALPIETVANESGMQLSIVDVNRNASLEAIPSVEGRETIIVTVELANLSSDSVAFDGATDFLLLNAEELAYRPKSNAVDGELGQEMLAPGEGVQGRLAFEIIADEVDLILVWEPEGSQARYIYLE